MAKDCEKTIVGPFQIDKSMLGYDKIVILIFIKGRL